MIEKKTEALVIGAGPGGYVCAIRLGQLGIETVLVEKKHYGGTCLNEGCIPSKALINVAKRKETIESAAEFGLCASFGGIDLEKIQEWKRGVVGGLSDGVKQLCKAAGVEMLDGAASFVAKNRVLVRTSEEEYEITAEKIVIASGSEVIQIPGFAFDGENVISPAHALSLEKLPARLAVIGGGYIGLELGMVYAGFGSEVTVIEMMDELLPGFDKDLVRPVSMKLKKMGVGIRTKSRALGYEKTADGLKLNYEWKGKPQELLCDKILVSVGRRPYADGLNISAAGLSADAKGFIPVNDRMETAVDGIYAIGDITGNPMLAHRASRQGEVLAEILSGHDIRYDNKVVPSVVFTDPQIAGVGPQESELLDAGHGIIIGRFPFGASGMANASGHPEGFVKVVADASTKQILSIYIVGHAAADLIGEAGLAVERGLKLEDVYNTIHAHPTFSESLAEACMAAEGRAVHIVNR